MDPLVSSDWLRARLDQPRLRIVDCRFDLRDRGAGRRAYEQGHIPGAAFADLDEDLAAPPGAPDPAHPRGPVGGRHPLPDLDRFAAAMRRAGIGTGTTVVAYDDAMSGGAARLWWLLRHAGFDEVAVLDRGLAGWDGPLERGISRARPPGDFKPGPVRRDDVVTAEQIAADRERAEPDRELLVLDARTPERFRGDAEPIDPVAGHVPGARNLPAADALTPPQDVLDTRRTPVASCGSGVTACVILLGLAAAGREDGRLYAGSWSDWVARGLPVARGDEPGPATGREG